ncbi:hypothetical protein C9J85_12310 [Haloferax sp. wsp5]|nr:hypothetical protein C9J85_12310 [Haloferax sp. wsp5]
MASDHGHSVLHLLTPVAPSSTAPVSTPLRFSTGNEPTASSGAVHPKTRFRPSTTCLSRRRRRRSATPNPASDISSAAPTTATSCWRTKARSRNGTPTCARSKPKARGPCSSRRPSAARFPSSRLSRTSARARHRRPRGAQRDGELHPLADGAEGLDYEHVLAEAQDLGVAEADPTFDVDGTDAALKGVIIANVLSDGETEYTLDDAEVTGFRRYPVARSNSRGRTVGRPAHRRGGGRLRPRRPATRAGNAPLAVSGTRNTRSSSRHAGQLGITGRGAGGPETASAVLADIGRLSAGRRVRVRGEKR